MAAKKNTPCVAGQCCPNRAAFTIAVTDMRGVTIHILDVCERCSHRTFQLIDGVVVDVAEVPALKKQTERIASERLDLQPAPRRNRASTSCDAASRTAALLLRWSFRARLAKAGSS